MITFTQVDAEEIGFVFGMFHDAIKVPIKVLFLIISLYMFIGISFLAALGVIIIFGYINYFIAIVSKSVQKTKMKSMSKRIHKVSEIIDNIKVIKFNSWTDKYLNIVNKERFKEILYKTKKELLWALDETLMNLDFPLLTISVFLVAVLGAKMSVTVPTALAIFQLLKSLNNS